jgi:hypothetical protein
MNELLQNITHSISDLVCFAALREGEVLTHLALYLHLHVVLHFSAGAASTAVHNQNVQKNEGHKKADNFASGNCTFSRDGGHSFHDGLLGLSVQSFKANLRRFGEAGTDGVKYGKRFDLASVCLFIDYDRWINIRAESLPIGDFSVY